MTTPLDSRDTRVLTCKSAAHARSNRYVVRRIRPPSTAPSRAIQPASGTPAPAELRCHAHAAATATGRPGASPGAVGTTDVSASVLPRPTTAARTCAATCCTRASGYAGVRPCGEGESKIFLFGTVPFSRSSGPLTTPPGDVVDAGPQSDSGPDQLTSSRRA